MADRPLNVIIIGAGTGGLCLAHGLLSSSNVSVQVFERDRSPNDRLQGYRLSVNHDGAAALQSCLPDEQFQRLLANSANRSVGLTFLDHRVHRLLAMDFPASPSNGVPNELPVSRIALRRVLLEGLDSVVQFGKKFVVFEDGPDSQVTARFEDSSCATGDLVVGADGAGSHVRAQLLPHARRIETGIFAVSGKFALTPESRAATPPDIFRGPTLFLGPNGTFLFASTVEYGTSARPAASATCSHVSAYDRDEYVMWGFSAQREKFRLPPAIEHISGDEWKNTVLALMRDWHPALRALIERADSASINPFSVKTSVRIDPWPTRNVTLLGDALHNMTPYRGIGANTALRDAAALCAALRNVARGEAPLFAALAGFERSMIDYGFRAVETSLKEMRRLHSENPFSRALTKTFFRAVDLFPPLKSALRAG
ncbi:MAG TPA: NAD(P)/FAD-dependent oxidoreductase [Candidatus Acidoferrum sp.]